MSEATLPFNQAVHTALKNDAVLVAYLGGEWVYSGVLAQDVKRDDFIILDTDDTVAPWTRFNGLALNKPREGEILGLQIDAWSRIRRADGTQVMGKERVLTLAGHVARILNNHPLTMPSYGFLLTGRVQVLRTMRDPGGVLMRSMMRFEAFVTRQPGDLPDLP